MLAVPSDSDKMEAGFIYYVEQVGRALARERRFRDRLDPLELSDNELLRKYRFPRRELQELFEELGPALSHPTARSNPLPIHTQVLMALRLMASGSFQNVIGDTAGKICMIMLDNSPLEPHLTIIIRLMNVCISRKIEVEVIKG